MIDKNFVEKSVEEFLAGSSIFVVEVKVSSRNKITVYLDGDNGVVISECVKVSRHLESLLDREVEDFELEVSSVGIDKPLKLLRQYHKNIGRQLLIEDVNGLKITATLREVSDSHIIIEPNSSKKKKKKDQPLQEAKQTLPFDQIKEAKVQVSFKNIPDDTTTDNKD